MPSALACLGPWISTCCPSHSISPPSKGWIPAIDLMSVLLPAPLSPTSAVTFPGYVSRSTPRSTCTAPKLLSTCRRDSNGCPCGVVVCATAMTYLGARDAVLLAGLLQGIGRADVRGLDVAVLDDLLDVLREDRLRGQQ